MIKLKVRIKPTAFNHWEAPRVMRKNPSPQENTQNSIHVRAFYREAISRNYASSVCAHPREAKSCGFDKDFHKKKS